MIEFIRFIEDSTGNELYEFKLGEGEPVGDIPANGDNVVLPNDPNKTWLVGQPIERNYHQKAAIVKLVD